MNLIDEITGKKVIEAVHDKNAGEVRISFEDGTKLSVFLMMPREMVWDIDIEVTKV